MSTIPTQPAERRHVWRWVILGCLALFALLVLGLGLFAVSVLSLSRDAAVLRNQVMAATDGGWHRKVQLSVGPLALTAVRTGLAFAHGKDIQDARLALASVRKASVGVYERSSRTSRQDAQLFAETDRAMAKRGWTRLVGVREHDESVLVYAPQSGNGGATMDICLAVVSRGEMVVVSTTIEADALAELVARHAPDCAHGHFRLARLHY